MTKQETINVMIETVNGYNAELMRQGGMTEDQISGALLAQRPALEGMFGLIYDALAEKDVFK